MIYFPKPPSCLCNKEKWNRRSKTHLHPIHSQSFRCGNCRREAMEYMVHPMAAFILPVSRAGSIPAEITTWVNDRLRPLLIEAREGGPKEGAREIPIPPFIPEDIVFFLYRQEKWEYVHDKTGVLTSA